MCNPAIQQQKIKNKIKRKIKQRKTRINCFR